MGTQTALDALGLNSVEGQIHGSTSDSAKDTSKPQYRDASNEAVDRLSGEYVDQSEPHSDQRRGGIIGTPSTVTPPHTKDDDTAHDGLGGRGPGKKNVDGDWDEVARA